MQKTLIGFILGGMTASALWWWCREPAFSRADGKQRPPDVSVEDFAQAVRQELGPLLATIAARPEKSPTVVRLQEHATGESEVLLWLDAVEQALLGL